MAGFFLNPWMLLGLAGIALPVIVHLISRKKYDLVDWGAMQFLQLEPSAKRRVRLEELLLLLVRMGLIAVSAVALARPWIASHWLTGFVSTQPRDVVLVIDGSYSMNWEGKTATPHAKAVQMARQFLTELRGGDSVQIIDAREQPSLVLPDFTHDLQRARQALHDLPVPAGTADLAAATTRAVELLSAGTNLNREVVVFSDLQALSWKVTDQATWARFDDVQSQTSVLPRVWVVDVAESDFGHSANFTIDRLKLSKEFAVVGVPVKISSTVRYRGGEAPAMRKVHLEIDQQRQADQAIQLKLQPQGEAAVEFERRFDSPGSHLISLVLEDDALPGDNRADAVISVIDSLPVLLVDGDPQADPTKSETFFANAALRSGGSERSWIKVTTITPEELSVGRLKSMSLVVIANVAMLSDPAIDALRQFVSNGHAVLFTLGDRIDKARYEEMFSKGDQDLFPCNLDAIVTEDNQEKRGVRVANGSLELPWQRPFRADQGGSLSDARWSRWWKVNLPDVRPETPSLVPNNGDALFDDNQETKKENHAPRSPIGPAIVEVRLTNGDPLIVSRRFGRGASAVFTSSLDADWNTLPAKLDYVPFLHEFLFSLASLPTSRNLDIGQPLVLPVPDQLKVAEYHFLDPADKSLPAERLSSEFQPTVRLRTTKLPGAYRFTRKVPKANEISQPEYFAVNFDRAESDLTQLTNVERDVLAEGNRMTFISDLPDLKENMFTNETRAEFWWVLLYVFLGFLIVETIMTRRMVHGAKSADANVATSINAVADAAK